MAQFLKENEVENALCEFVNRTLVQLNQFGFNISNISGLYTLKLDDEPVEQKDKLNTKNGRCWFRRPEWSNSYWPCSDSPGVYIFFNESKTACYVGKAEKAIGYRASAHSGSPGPDGNYPDCEYPEAEYLISIPFKLAPFLSPAFESFLLSRYEFCYNKQHNKLSLKL
jgi:hypothetical protein